MDRLHSSNSPFIATPARGPAVRLGLVLLLLVAGLLLGAANRPPPIQAAPPTGLAAADWQAIQAMLPPSQQAYLKASNTGTGDRFGFSVSVSGDTVVVGAYAERSAATGVGGNPADNSAPTAGAAYVFVRTTGIWSQQAYLKAANTAAEDQFGWSVAVSGDTIVIGANGEDSAATGVDGNPADNTAPAAGAAYVFTRSGTTWSQQAYLKAANTAAGDHFGWSVAVSGDTVVVGAISEDSAATGMGGNPADNSATDAGAAYVFTRSAAQGAPVWTQQAYLKASNTDAYDRFSVSVAVSGDTIVVGAEWEDSAAMGVGGNPADNSALYAGAAYVFTRSGATWTPQAYLKASNTDGGDSFGASVAVSGDTLVVGADGEASATTGVDGNPADNSAINAGAAYVFTRSGATWSQQVYLKASNTDAADHFGASVAVSGDTLVVGAWSEGSATTGVGGNQADNSAFGAGAAYVFMRSGTTWSQQVYLKASNTDAGDGFGYNVAVAGDMVVVGAPNEASAAGGVGGNQADNTATQAGAAYVFGEGVVLPTATPTTTATATATPTTTATATVATATSIPAGGPRAQYLPLLVVIRDWRVTINAQAIPTRPVTTVGETYYTTTIVLPAPLPSGGQFYFSSAPDRVQAITVDDALVVTVNGQERLVVAATSPLVVEVPRAEITQWLGQSVVVSFRDTFGEVVGSTPVWLIWVP